MVDVSCTKCGKVNRFPEQMRGQRVTCDCGETFFVPGGDTSKLTLRRKVDKPERAAAAEAATATPEPAVASSVETETALPDEAERRERNLRILGIILLIGFVMPVVLMGRGANMKVMFPNFEVFRGEVPWQMIVMALSPGIAGIGVLAVNAKVEHPVRGLVLLLLAFLPVLLVLTDPDVVKGLIDGIAKGKWKLGMSGASIAGLLNLVGVTALFVGTRARWYRPALGAAHVIGFVGGGCYLLHLFLPVLPDEMWRIPLAMPFRLLMEEGTRLIGIGLVAGLAATIAAAVICLFNRNDDAEVVRDRAVLAFRLLIAGLLLPLLFVLVEADKADVFANSGGMLFMALTIIVKSSCMIVGMLLLIPTAIVDLLIGKRYVFGAGSGA